MDITRIEVKRTASENAPIIEIRTRLSLRPRRTVRYSLRVLGATYRAIRGLFPRRVYLTLD